MKFYTSFFSALTFAALVAGPALAEEPHVAPIKELIESSLRKEITAPVIIEAIKAQNAANANLSQSDIDKLDKQWRAEVDAGSKPLIDKVRNSPASDHLGKVKEAGKGTYVEIFVMDNKGLNVALSDVTSDYWQGDEGKFKNTFAKGADAVFIDQIEKDESTQTLQSQASFTIVDPANGQPIGAVTIGINVDDL